MCGIYGQLRFDGRPIDAERVVARRDQLAHRGPDDAGLRIDGPIALAHRRLSILDLSPQGRQPMSNEDGSIWIVLNGEIYNFAELRAGLEGRGHRFRSRSDTEVIVHLYEDEGPACVARLRGMFAFALWDGRDRSLLLARDRVGKKPLFYSRSGGALTFASELGPLVAELGAAGGVDPIALHHYLSLQSVPHPWTAFRDIRKLPPAHWLRARDGEVELRRYWRLEFEPKAEARGAAGRRAVERELLGRLDEAVRIRLVADVPVGALLSGGVDSSAVVALMAKALAGRPLETFSVGFDEPAYDERRYARRVAREVGSEHFEQLLRPDASELLPQLVERFGEPFADPAALPTLELARLARRRVTVALCGDGGDEGFAGYHRHKLQALLGWLPRLPESAGRWLSALSAGAAGSRRHPLWVARRVATALALHPARRNLRFLGHFDGPAKAWLYTPEFAATTAGQETGDLMLDLYRESGASDPLDAILYAETRSYLADTLLPKVDVTAMTHALEVRSPFLDHELMEFAARLPSSLKVRWLQSKWILKRALRGLLPKEILERPKMGFGVPLDRWFGGEWRGLLHDVLLSDRALARGYFQPQAVAELVRGWERGRRFGQYHLYDLLVLELWHRRFVDSR